MLILIASAMLIVILAIVLFTTSEPEGNEGAGAAQPAPEQQVEEGNADMPVSPRRPSPPLED